MDNHDSVEAIKASQKKYLMVFGVLLVGTMVTVGMYYVYFKEVWQTVSVALLIAGIKAACVAGVFMHLSAERKLVYQVLFFTGIFAIGMLGLTVWAYYSTPFMTTYVR